MGILSWIIMGLLVGALAKFIMPGNDPGGLVVTILLGIAGAFVGGFLATRLGLGSVTGFNLGSIGIATGGALLLLFVYRRFRR
ncbi:membrane protein [Desulfuromonas versatilis]|uniref:Membrane protein n=1 Tax=Desulfuromonas versatilis TaxID=2802975 RepID=A0ABM8HWY7_9BACT|nr:GlsB/YeaQ/YmgE family stress response membrane protein [Desulfuromonas versatilis]BCR05037.1 membrane protein [Desulfuromonas versatilis]